MASSKLTKDLYTDMTKLKLLDKEDAEVRFRLTQSPFDVIDSPEELAADKREEFLVVGQIFPKSDLYRERAYPIEMKLPKSFPFEPPVTRFLIPMYHLNIEKNGTLCNVLFERTAAWTPKTSLVDIVKSVVNCFDKPDFDYAVSLGMATEYKENRPEFDRKVLECVRKHGLPR